MDELKGLEDGALRELLDRFYARVRDDAELAPIFNAAIDDWSEHLDRLSDFWSSVMLATGRYKGNPMARHMPHAKVITPAMFTRWLALWEATTNEMAPPDIALLMQAKARRIGASLELALRPVVAAPASKPHRTITFDREA
jgi:hemoglobin